MDVRLVHHFHLVLTQAMVQNRMVFLASLNSLTKLPYEWALDGISNTQTMNPDALGHNEEERVANLVNVMDGYFDQGAHHLNVNVFGKDKLTRCYGTSRKARIC